MSRELLEGEDPALMGAGNRVYAKKDRAKTTIKGRKKAATTAKELVRAQL